ncbi:MAG: DUF6390 family protein [Candidatus Micrarchaeia archaeon]
MLTEKAGVTGIHRALRYAFPPNQLKLCGPKLDIDSYRLLFENTEKAREFLISLPYLGKRCAKIAMQRNLDTFDSRVINAYFLGIYPYEENGRPMTHLMDILITDGTMACNTKNDAARTHFITRLNSCTVRCGTVISSGNYNIFANITTFAFSDNKIVQVITKETLTPLPFDNIVPKPGQAITTHGLYLIETISQEQLRLINVEVQREIKMFNDSLKK